MTMLLRIFLILLLFFAAMPASAQIVPRADPAGTNWNSGAGDTAQDMSTMQTGRIQIPRAPVLNIPGAAEKADILGQTLDMLDKLPPAQRKTLVEEAKVSKSYCYDNAILGGFYDCSCFALRMLDTRLHRGPGTPIKNLIPVTDLGVCVTPPGIAGYTYNRCMDTMRVSRYSDKDLKSLCECTARSFTPRWVAGGRPTSTYITNLFSSALDGCIGQMGLNNYSQPPSN